jgi:hypothetical protein
LRYQSTHQTPFYFVYMYMYIYIIISVKFLYLETFHTRWLRVYLFRLNNLANTCMHRSIWTSVQLISLKHSIPYPETQWKHESVAYSQMYSADDFIGFLMIIHNIRISKRTFCRLSKRLQLKRNCVECPAVEKLRKMCDLHR